MVGPSTSVSVFPCRDGFQVIRIDAAPVPASMINLQAVRNGSYIQLIEDTVRALEASLVPNLAISVERRRAQPHPAAGAGVDGVAAMLPPTPGVSPKVSHGPAFDDSLGADGLLGDPGIRSAPTMALAERDRRHLGLLEMRPPPLHRRTCTLGPEGCREPLDPLSRSDAVALPALAFAVGRDIDVVFKEQVTALAGRRRVRRMFSTNVTGSRWSGLQQARFRQRWS